MSLGRLRFYFPFRGIRPRKESFPQGQKAAVGGEGERESRRGRGGRADRNEGERRAGSRSSMAMTLRFKSGTSAPTTARRTTTRVPRSAHMAPPGVTQPRDAHRQRSTATRASAHTATTTALRTSPARTTSPRELQPVYTTVCPPRSFRNRGPSRNLLTRAAGRRSSTL